MSRRLILVANDFPPIGGAGTQRPLYFAKYLPELGWFPHVLTVRDVVYPVMDETLLDELPRGVEIHRTESGEFRRLLWHLRRLRREQPRSEVRARQDEVTRRAWLRDLGRKARQWAVVPDDRMLWMPFAVCEADRIAERWRPEVVVATVPSYSSGVIGYIISRRLRIPLVVDLRDPWTRDPYSPMPTALHRSVNRHLEALTLRHASEIVVISRRMAVDLGDAFPEVKERISVITNGVDLERFDRVEPVRQAEGFSCAFVGSLYAHHRSSIEGFCQGWRRACDRSPRFAQVANLLIVGRVDPEIEKVFRAAEGMRVSALGYVPHDEAIAVAKGASALFFTIRNLDPERDLITIPGKLFEYLASRRPIVMVGPEGDAADLVREAGGYVEPESDVEGICRALLSVADGGTAGGKGGDPSRFDRRALTGLLVACLERAIEQGDSLGCEPRGRTSS